MNNTLRGAESATLAPDRKIKERPIIFCGPMVRAIQEGRKTQTRRVVKYHHMLGYPNGWCAAAKAQEPGWVHIVGDYRRFCPHGAPGDRLWVRETWADLRGMGFDDMTVAYFANSINPRTGEEDCDAKRCRLDYGAKWRPSIFMPRWASRILLEITDVRVQRLQEISQDDAKAEGVEYDPCDHFRQSCEDIGCRGPYGAPFSELWDRINAARGHSWDVNPWVWAITFRRVEEGTPS